VGRRNSGDRGQRGSGGLVVEGVRLCPPPGPEIEGLDRTAADPVATDNTRGAGVAWLQAGLWQTSRKRSVSPTGRRFAGLLNASVGARGKQATEIPIARGRINVSTGAATRRPGAAKRGPSRCVLTGGAPLILFPWRYRDDVADVAVRPELRSVDGRSAPASPRIMPKSVAAASRRAHRPPGIRICMPCRARSGGNHRPYATSTLDQVAYEVIRKLITHSAPPIVQPPPARGSDSILDHTFEGGSR
jgi:hypothetical protein